ncbi:ParB-like chromosome segregation protein Spo0J [Bradyrhizobium sp. USDA 3256]
MATAVQKVTLSAARDIPFYKLVLSQANVRRVKVGVSIEELAESIARRGLIQSLHVRPVLNADGQETGMYEVPAGGRRYRALRLLVKQKRFTKTSSVPCVFSEANGEILIDEFSLAENIERAPLDADMSETADDSAALPEFLAGEDDDTTTDDEEDGNPCEVHLPPDPADAAGFAHPDAQGSAP